jgi:carotenoid cleavage dioxygenase-like enzyme
MDSFVFNPSEPTLFYVISRETGDVIATYRSDPCFAFHHVNAFEDDCGSIFVDMICYRDDTIARQLNIHTLRNPHLMEPSRLASSEVRRYRLNNVEDEKMNYLEHSRSIPSQTTISNRLSSLFGYFKGGKPPQQQRDVLEYGAGGDGKKWYSWMPIASFDKRVQPSLELPQVNPNYKLHKYNFMYGLGFAPSSVIQDGAIWDSIVKIVSDRFRERTTRFLINLF